MRYSSPVRVVLHFKARIHNFKRSQSVSRLDNGRLMSTSPSFKRSPSPHHRPNTDHHESDVYVLTLLTDEKHHNRLTQLRTKYFPKHLNHLGAHITLFHSLPGSKLDTIISNLKDLANDSKQFRLLATTPFKLNKGIAIGLPKSAGGDETRMVHSALQKHWQEFLSEQDANGIKPHYTIMNKVDDRKEIDKAYDELKRDFKPVEGVVEGLRLWRYDTHGWEFLQDFRFRSDQ